MSLYIIPVKINNTIYTKLRRIYKRPLMKSDPKVRLALLYLSGEDKPRRPPLSKRARV